MVHKERDIIFFQQLLQISTDRSEFCTKITGNELNNAPHSTKISISIELSDKRKEPKATKNTSDENRVKYNDLT